MITKKEVKHIAKLARLELTDKEVEKMQKDLSSILDYFKALQGAPQISADMKTDLHRYNKNNFRLDEAVESESVDEIIQQFPDKNDNYIKVKQVL